MLIECSSNVDEWCSDVGVVEVSRVGAAGEIDYLQTRVGMGRYVIHSANDTKAVVVTNPPFLSESPLDTKAVVGINVDKNK